MQFLAQNECFQVKPGLSITGMLPIILPKNFKESRSVRSSDFLVGLHFNTELDVQIVRDSGNERDQLVDFIMVHNLWTVSSSCQVLKLSS